MPFLFLYYCAKLGFIHAIGMSASKEGGVGVVPKEPGADLAPEEPGAEGTPELPGADLVPEEPDAGGTPMWARSAGPSL